MSDTFELTVSRIIPASCKGVFEAWLSPDAHEGGWGRILGTLGSHLD